MRKNDSFYRHLLQECQSADLQHRLEALEDLRRHEYLDLVEAQFLLDRLNSTSHWQEQTAILQLMSQIEKPLPIDALMAILADGETSPLFLRMEVAHILAVARAEEALDLLVRLVLDAREHPWLREVLTGDLAIWKERITDELLLTLLAVLTQIPLRLYEERPTYNGCTPEPYYQDRTTGTLSILPEDSHRWQACMTRPQNEETLQECSTIPRYEDALPGCPTKMIEACHI